MDLGSILLLGSVAIIAVILTIGPILELRGKILFEKREKTPVLKRRFGMAIMIFGALIFVIALVFRYTATSEQVTPFVWSGYILWIIGGIIAVARNELLKMMVPQEDRQAK